MFGGHIKNIIDHYKITSFQRFKLRKLVGINDDIRDLVEEYRKIELRIHTCTAMDNDALRDKILKLVELFSKLIESCEEEDKLQYKALVQASDKPSDYIDFMIRNTTQVLEIATMRNQVLNEILCPATKPK